jgi:muconolactone delta-isomerase
VSEFMAVCTFKEGTDMSDVLAVVAQEREAVAAMRSDGSVGEVKLATPQGKVFIQAFADDAETAHANIASLPMAAWWDIEVYAIVPPAPAQ